MRISLGPRTLHTSPRNRRPISATSLCNDGRHDLSLWTDGAFCGEWQRAKNSKSSASQEPVMQGITPFSMIVSRDGCFRVRSQDYEFILTQSEQKAGYILSYCEQTTGDVIKQSSRCSQSATATASITLMWRQHGHVVGCDHSVSRRTTALAPFFVRTLPDPRTLCELAGCLLDRCGCE